MVVSYTASGDTFVASTPRLWAQKNDWRISIWRLTASAS